MRSANQNTLAGTLPDEGHIAPPSQAIGPIPDAMIRASKRYKGVSEQPVQRWFPGKPVPMDVLNVKCVSSGVAWVWVWEWVCVSIPVSVCARVRSCIYLFVFVFVCVWVGCWRVCVFGVRPNGPNVSCVTVGVNSGCVGVRA